MNNSNRSTAAASPLIASEQSRGTDVERSAGETIGRTAGLLENFAAQLLSAVLAALVITLTLVGFATLYGWYRGVHYPEGVVVRSLALGVILFAALTAAIIWECRDKR